MDENLVISLELLNAAKVMQQITQVAQVVKSLPNPIQQIAKSAQAATGPMQRLAKAAQDVKKALAFGDPARIFDAQFHFLKAQRAQANAQHFMQNPNGTPFLQKLLSVVRSSRIGIGGGGLSILPLVGQLSSLFGKAGPWGIAIAAGAEALMGFVSAVQNASQAILSATAGQYALMTSAAGASRVSAAGAALGMSSQQATQLFHKIYEDMSVMGGNYPAIGVAQRFGVHALGGPFDLNDQAAAVFKVIEGLQKLPFKEQQAALQKMGAAGQELAPLLNLPLSDIQQLTDMQKQLYSPENIKNAMRFHIAMAVVQQWFTNFIMSLLDWVQRIPGWIKGILHIPDMSKDLDKMKKTLDDHADAMDGHTKALNDHTKAIMGGGERARGAMPAALRGMALDNALRGQAINLGAFAV